PLINETRVELNERRPGIELLHRVVRAHDSTYSNHGERRARRNEPHDLRRARLERSSAQSTLRVAFRWDGRMIERRVRCDDPGKLGFVAECDDLFDRIEFEIRRDFDQHRTPVGVPLLDSANELLERAAVLQLAEAGRIRGTDVQDKVIRELPQSLKRWQVVADSCLHRRDLGLADIDTHRNSRPFSDLAQNAKPICQKVTTVIVEPEPIDDRLALWNAKDPRLGIARLRAGGDRPNFHKAKSQGIPCRKGDAILVKTGSHPHRIGKLDPKNCALVARVVCWTKPCYRRSHMLQYPHRHVVNELRVETKEQRPEQLLIKGGGKHGRRLVDGNRFVNLGIAPFGSQLSGMPSLQAYPGYQN